MTTPAAERHTPMFPTTEGDLWRWQLETMTELAKFIRAHGPGLPGALPAVPWQVSTGFHAVARLSQFDGPPAAPRDLLDVLDAYAAALGSEVTSVDLGRGDTEYRVKGSISERVTVTLIATIRADDNTDGAEVPCPDCAGRGLADNDEPCLNCAGTGREDGPE